VNRGTYLGNATGDFVPQNQRPLSDTGELRPIAVGYVEIRMTNATGFQSDQDFSSLQHRTRNILKYKRLFEFVEDGGLHRFTSLGTKRVRQT